MPWRFNPFTGNLDETDVPVFNGEVTLGSATNPSIFFSGDPNTGLFSPGADQVSLTTGGTERLRIDSTGQIKAVSLGTAAAPTYSFTGDPNTGIYSPGADQLALSVSGSEKVRLTTTGLGIGTTSVDTNSLLDVNGVINLSNNSSISWGGGTGRPSIVGDKTDKHVRVVTDGFERARIDSSGRLLVGTSSSRGIFSNQATAALQIEGVGATPIGRYLSLINNNSSGGNIGGTLVVGGTRGTTVGSVASVAANDQLGVVSFQGADGTNLIQGASITSFVDGTPGADDMPGRLVFSTTADGASSPTERLRITSAGVLQVADAGNIAVGTTTGTKIGTATTQKLGFFNKTPVVQPAAVADATDAASVITQLNALLARMRDLGLIAT